MAPSGSGHTFSHGADRLPSEFGKEGRVAKSVHKDAQDQLGIKRCSQERKNEVCAGPLRDEQKCLECG
jgi:hypothetical protein